MPPTPWGRTGFTLVELLVVIAIIGILSAIGYVNYVKQLDPVRDATAQMVAELSRARADAMANTQARRLILENATTLRVETALRCSQPENDETVTPPVKNWTTSEKVTWPDLNRQHEVQLLTSTPTDTPNIIACFTSRGMADKARSFTVKDSKTKYAVDVALGGGIDFNAVP